MMPLSLDDKYTVERGRIFLSGVQSLVRLVLDQHRLDARAGLKTGGFISGYRGSPLGGVDTALWHAAPHLAAADIHFEPGLNEELAVTAVAGSQHTGIVGGSRFDGVFGLWYAKNPGLDRAADALKHANAAGTTPNGGVLAVSGDDPGASSSSLPNQCDQAFIAALMPVLNPANMAEILEYGHAGFALSRYAGLWVGLKTVSDTIECTASLDVDPIRRAFALPNDFEPPSDGLGIRWPDERWDQDARLLDFKLPAALAFTRANALDRTAFGAGGRRRFTIVASGKAYNDVRQALADLGIDQAMAEAAGLSVYKVAMAWPLEGARLRDAVEGSEEVFVVEERRAVIETQLKELAYNWPAERRPRIVGKIDETGTKLLPVRGELSPAIVALAIGKRLRRLAVQLPIGERLRRIEARASEKLPSEDVPTRIAHFCAGCPHARSTRVPEGSIAFSGIGCHSLRTWMPDSHTVYMPQMGGEGANWIGLAPFVETSHVFQNMGDGTYCHSGSLSIRAAVAARRRITFRILYNEVTAMTGGQPVEGALTVPQIARQLAAEGVGRVVVVADDPGKYPLGSDLGPDAVVRHRDDLEAVESELRDWPGVSAIVYDQVCATEKRRRRKRLSLPAATVRPFINARVCDGCGDCVDRSQCAAVMPVETALGTKRRIDQSACNVDLSCLDGFCPSFVTVEGGQLRHPAPILARSELPAPPATSLTAPYDLIVGGIGGTGVMTIGAILGMAAHLAGKGCSVLDNTGMARKGGAVSSHIRLAPDPDDIHVTRIGDAGAAVVLACDMVSSVAPVALAKIDKGRTHVVANADAVPTLNQSLDPDSHLDTAALRRRIVAAAGAERCAFIDATEIAEHLVGDTIFANMVMLGYTCQKGLVPLPLDAIVTAIELNGSEVERNRAAFEWGRREAHDPAVAAAQLRSFRVDPPDATLDALIAHQVAHLTRYQDAAYAERYARLVAQVREAERRLGRRDGPLAWAVAKAYFSLLAVKDEYEVARLYGDGEFARALQRQFTGAYRVRYHLAPPLLARRDPASGRVRKQVYGPWMGWVFPALAAMKRVRGTWLDPFGYTEERRMERRLIADYQELVAGLLAGLDAANYALAAEIAGLAERVRGYGDVKARNLASVKTCEAALVAAFHGTTARAA